MTPRVSDRSAGLGDGGEEWIHRPVRGQNARKVYRCPGCDHPIQIAEPHVVAWRDDWTADASDRRHWHTACWRGRHRMPSGRRRPSSGHSAVPGHPGPHG